MNGVSDASTRPPKRLVAGHGVVPLLADAADRLRTTPPAGFPGRPGRPRKVAEPERAGERTSSVPSPHASAPVPQASAPTPRPPLTRPRARAVTGLSPFVPRLMTVQQAAAYMAVGRDYVYGLVQAGRLARYQLPGVNTEVADFRKILLERADVDAFLDAHRTESR